MKKIISILFLMAGMFLSAQPQPIPKGIRTPFILPTSSTGYVGINTTDPEAALDIVSTENGVLVPRLTATQKNNILSPHISELVWDLTAGNFQYWNGTSWIVLGEGSGGDFVPYIGATSDVNLGIHTLRTKQLTIDDGGTGCYIGESGDIDGLFSANSDEQIAVYNYQTDVFHFAYSILKIDNDAEETTLSSKFSQTYGDLDGINDGTTFNIGNNFLDFKSLSGSDGDNFGFAGFQVSPSAGFYFNVYNPDNSRTNFDSYVNGESTKSVETTSDDSAFIVNNVYGISGSTSVQQTPNQFKMSSNIYSDGLFQIYGSQVNIGDIAFEVNGTSVQLDDDNQTVNVKTPTFNIHGFGSVDEGSEDYSDLNIVDKTFTFIGISGADGENLGHGVIQIAPGNNNLINTNNAGTIKSDFIQSQTMVNTDVINFTDSTSTFTKQTSNNWYVGNNAFYGDSGLLGVNPNEFYSYIGDYGNEENNTYIKVDDDAQEINVNAAGGFNWNGQQVLTSNSGVGQGVDDSTTIALTSANLNSTYPGVFTGFKVYCTSIIAGKMVYEKTPSGWVGYTCIIP